MAVNSGGIGGGGSGGRTSTSTSSNTNSNTTSQKLYITPSGFVTPYAPQPGVTGYKEYTPPTSPKIEPSSPSIVNPPYNPYPGYVPPYLPPTVVSGGAGGGSGGSAPSTPTPSPTTSTPQSTTPSSTLTGKEIIAAREKAAGNLIAQGMSPRNAVEQATIYVGAWDKNVTEYNKNLAEYNKPIDSTTTFNILYPGISLTPRGSYSPLPTPPLPYSTSTTTIPATVLRAQTKQSQKEQYIAQGRLGTEEKGTPIITKTFDTSGLITPGFLFKEREKDLYDKESKKYIPTFSEYKIMDVPKSSPSYPYGEAIVRKATPEEIANQEILDKSLKIDYVTTPEPSAFVRSYREFTGSLNLESPGDMIKRNLETYNIIGSEGIDKGLNKLASNPTFNKFIQAYGYTREKTQPFGGQGLAADISEPYLKSAIIYAKDNPATVAYTFGTGALFGGALKGVGLGIGALSKTTKAYDIFSGSMGYITPITKYGNRALSLGFGAYQVYNVGGQLFGEDTKDLTYQQRVDILSREAVNTAAFLGGARVGSNVVGYLAQPRLAGTIKYTELELTKSQLGRRNKINPQRPLKQVYFSDEDALRAMQKYIGEGYKVQIKEGAQKVFMPRIKQILSFGIEDIKPTYAGNIKGGLFYSNILGNKEIQLITPKQARVGYNKMLNQLMGEGLSRNQARQYLRMQRPSKIESLLTTEDVVYMDLKSKGKLREVVKITGTQINKPIKSFVYGESDKINLNPFKGKLKFSQFSANVKSGGMKQTLKVEANLEKMALEKNSIIERKIKGIETEPKLSIYQGTKTTQRISGGTFKPKTFTEKYIVEQTGKVRIETPFEGSSKFLQKELLTQRAYSQELIGGKPRGNLFADVSKTKIITEGAPQEVVLFKRYPKTGFTSKKNGVWDWGNEDVVKITKGFVTTGEMKGYKLIPGKAATAQSIPTQSEFGESYKLIGQKDIDFSQVPRSPETIITPFGKNVNKVLILNKRGRLDILNKNIGKAPKIPKRVTKPYPAYEKPIKFEETKPKYGGIKAQTNTFEETMAQQSKQFQVFEEPIQRILYKPQLPSLSITPTIVSNRNLFQLPIQKTNTVFAPLSFKTETQQSQILSPVTRQSFTPKVDTKVDTKLDTRLDIRTTVMPRVDTRIETRLEPKIETRLEPRIEAKIETRLEPKLEPRLEPNIKIPPIFNPPRIPSFAPRINFGYKKSQPLKQKISNQYSVLIKRRGKFVPVKTGLTRGRALQFGSTQVQKELSRQFKLVKTGTTTEADISFMPKENIYRAYKVRRGVKVPLVDQFIQKTAYNLQSREEKIMLAASRGLFA